jgi:hypothetical protein
VHQPTVPLCAPYLFIYLFIYSFIYLTSEPVAHIMKHQFVGLLVKTFGKSLKGSSCASFQTSLTPDKGLKFGSIKYETGVLPN